MTKTNEPTKPPTPLDLLIADWRSRICPTCSAPLDLQQREPLLCVLAATELEKGKKSPLALASQRRVESAPSPMKKDTDSAEIEALITRLEGGQLRDEDAQLLARLLRLLLHFPGLALT
jgi:hypothetical protein